MPDISASFSASKSLVGLAFTGMWAMFAVTQLPGGVLSDRYGERRLILLSLVLAAAGGVFITWSESFLTFGLCLLLFGAGGGIYLIASASFLARQFDDIGSVLGFHSAGGPLGGLVAPVVGVYVASRYGWRAGPLLFAVLLGFVAIAVLRTIAPSTPVRPETTMRAQITPHRLRALFVRPSVLYTTTIAVLTFFTWQATASFFPTFMVEYWNLSIESAGVAFAAVFALSSVGQPAFGRLSDRLGRDAVLGISLLTTAVAYGVLLVGPSPVAPIVGVALLGIGIGWGGVIQSRFMDVLSAEDRGVGYGLVNSVASVFGSLGSVVTGTLATTLGWRSAIALLIGFMSFGILVITSNRLLALDL